MKVLFITDKIRMGADDGGGGRDIRQYETEGWTAYVMGEVRYRDDGGADHYIGFPRTPKRR